MLMSSALVFLMIPALSLIYSGLGNRSFALTLFRLPMVTAAFIGLQVRVSGLDILVWRRLTGVASVGVVGIPGNIHRLRIAVELVGWR